MSRWHSISKRRLQNEMAQLAAFEASACGRLRVTARRHFDAIVEVGLLFPGVRTAIQHVDLRVEAHIMPVLATIRPLEGALPYPWEPPEVRLGWPRRLPEGSRPYLPGLHYFAPGDPLALLMGQNAFGPGAANGFGLPCLWRRWDPASTLTWLTLAVHRLLVVDPASMAAATDSLDPAAARFFAGEGRGLIPFEPPLDTAVPSPPAERSEAAFSLRRRTP